MSQRDDTQLLAAHVAGDDRAFSELIERHSNRLWTLALRVMRDPEDASDALQDAMISAFRRASAFRGDAAVTTWLHRIVMNACLDRLRRLKVRAAVPLPEDLDRTAVLVDSVGPEEAAVRASVADDVTEALSRISPDQRTALILVDMHGYSVNEAATMIGVAPGTIKSRCSRGRSRLSQLLDHLREVG